MPTSPLPLMRDQVEFYVTLARRETYITRERWADIGFFMKKKKEKKRKMRKKEEILDMSRWITDFAIVVRALERRKRGLVGSSFESYQLLLSDLLFFRMDKWISAIGLMGELDSHDPTE